MLKRSALILIISLLLTIGVIGQDFAILVVDESHIEFYYKIDNKIFPCKWRKKKISPRFSQLEQHEFKRSMGLMLKALEKYPGHLLDKNLKAVFMLREMSFFGLEYGGTYHKHKVYIVNDGVENGYTDDFVEGTFHHEFSSILLKRHKHYFDKKSWLKANASGFKYGDGGIEALKTSNAILELDSTLYRSGFLNRYSLSSVEEDFNCFAELLFLSDDDFWSAWETSDAIKRKTEIIIKFYHSLDPIFTLGYFRSF